MCAMSQPSSSEAGISENKWAREGEWHVWRERTTRPFPHIRIDATRMLHRGLSAFFAIYEWRGQVLHVRALGAEGMVSLEGGVLTTKVRFDFWGPASFVPFLKEKILSEIAAATVETAGANFFGKEIFIIHGHDHKARTELKTLLQSLGLNPILLIEQSDSGMTVIEKFEYYAKTCSFAFALMTPDDVVAGPDKTGIIWRARPNVNLEIGWFMARLGRTRVVMLLKGELDIPSDLNGIIFLPFKNEVTEAAAQIALRLREAGLV
jgi:predicted nucleotide-binding protein